MDNIFMQYGQLEFLSIEIIPFKASSNPTGYFDFIVSQKRNVPGAVTIAGGERYLIEKNWTTPECFTSDNNHHGNITGNVSYTSDTLLIDGNITVQSGGSFSLHNVVVRINEGKHITVEPGGAFYSDSCEFIPACPQTKWDGIQVHGGYDKGTSLWIKRSFFSGCDQPLYADSTELASIDSNSFLGSGTNRCINLYKMKGFSIAANTIFAFETGLRSYKNNQFASAFNRNIILDVDTAYYSSNDDNTLQDVLCNRFGYAQYAILTSATNQKDLGTASDGAGNEFISTSSNTYDKYFKTSGTSVTYYDDNAYPITSGMNITVTTARNDAQCFTYSFDTSSSRLKGPMITRESNVLSLSAQPNPNNGLAVIHYSLGESASGILTVTDIFGKVIDQVILEGKKETADVDYTKYPDGIYLLQLVNSKGESKSGKMIISK